MLKISEANFRAMADDAPVMMWVTLPDGSCVYLNRAWYEFTGQSPEEAVGYGWLDATHPDDKAEAERVFLAANAQQTPFRIEYRLRRADGSYCWAIDAASPRFGPDGEFLGYIGSVIDINERRQMENAWRIGEERLRLATEAAEVGFWDVDVVHDQLIWPPRVKAMFGISPDVPVSMLDYYDGLHPDDRAATVEAYRAACDPERRALYDVEYRTIGKEDGVIRWVAAKGRGIFDASGRCVRVIGTAIDITATRAAEEAAADVETRYRLLFASIEAGFCVVEVDLEYGGGRADYRVIEANPAFFSQTGFDKGIVGRWLRRAEPALEEHWYERYSRVARTGEPERFEQISDRLGRWFDVYAFRIENNAKLPQVAILFNDVSARRKAEAHLRELNETLERRVSEAIAERKLFADIVNGTDAFVQVVDREYRWLAVNRAAANEFERLFGVRPKTGLSMLDVLDDQPEHREAVQAIWARALAGEEFTEIAEFGGPERGRFYEMKFNSLRDLDGRQVGAYQFVHDVTRRINDQRRLAETEEQLRQMQKMETIGQLTGGVAHDFNNLLTPIVGALDLLSRRLAGDKRAELLTAGALQAAERSRVLIQRLLAFSRRQHLQPRPVDLCALITGMTDLIQRSIGPLIRMSIECPPGLPASMVDPNQFELAILNLVVNARDAMPSGGKLTIAVSLDQVAGHPKLLDGDYNRISVADTGIGMDAETLARAVEPFFTTKDVGRGTGLGLSSVHGLAAQSGGDFALTSQPGHGTTASLWLPVSRAHAESPENTEQQMPAPAEGKARLLLVDDEDLVRSGTADMLADGGYVVVEASSGHQALQLLRNDEEIDGVITDFAMPGMTGVSLTRQIKQLRRDLPVLLITGYATLTDRDGVDLPRLSKPYRQADLLRAVSELLSSQRKTAP